MAMTKISLATDQAGTVAEEDYLSEKGELLISKGVTISERHLEMLARRNIFDVFVKPSSEHDEIQHIMAKELIKLDDLDLDDVVPKASAQEAMGIKPGKDGLEQLNSSALTADLDKKLLERRSPDRPFGQSIELKATLMAPTERTDTYKTEMLTQYEDSLREVIYILNAIADRSLTDGRVVRVLSERIVRIFVSDRNILLALSRVKHSGFEYLYTHSLNVCLLSINIASCAGYNENQVVEIGMGALVHDVGMLLVPEEIRTKQGKLSESEWYEVQKHPILGLHLLERIKSLPESVPYVAYQVHERGNAKGYPKQRNSVLIHRFAKLVQVADIYEAMSSPRPHREPVIPYRAMESLIKMTRTGLISEEFVKAFLGYASLFPVGSFVQLSTGRIARVISSHKESFAKPVVSVLTDSRAKLLPKHEVYQIDLYTNKDVQIAKALSADFLQGVELMDGF